MKNDIVCKEKESTVFLKEREQYFEIQDLKAQLQDKNIAIISKSTFAKPYDVNAPSPSRNSPKHVSFQSPKEYVGSNDMVHNYYLEEAKKKAQLQKEKALNTKPSMQQYARLPNTANEPHRTSKAFLKVNDLACSKCTKCIFQWPNYDEWHLQISFQRYIPVPLLSKNDTQSHKTTKRYMPIEKKYDSKKHDRHIPIGQKFSPNKSSAVYLKTTPPRSGLTWKPTSRIFTKVGLKWIPIRKSVDNATTQMIVLHH
ncbi:hypothetical protein Tco_0655853 [Tanacetum coccineum]|uniref:Uncharacterized protein n=1 Tax=Tanacetum coccineum TaxID=301880 RepID=A0ABQ4X749_9ASTR